MAIAEQIARDLIKRKGLAQLLCRPFRGGMRGYIKMHDPTPVMPQHQKHVQHLESDGRYGKEVDRHQILTWLSRNVRQVCEGGLRRRTMYLATVISFASSFKSSVKQ